MGAGDARALYATMSKKDIILIISTSVLAITTAYYGLQYVRYKDHNTYHRSRMFELEMLSQISMVLPVGSTLDEFLYEFGLDKSAYHALNDSAGFVSIKPSLRIPVNEQKDYTGFSFHFENNILIRLSPNGPQPEEFKVDIGKTPLGKKLSRLQ